MSKEFVRVGGIVAASDLVDKDNQRFDQTWLLDKFHDYMWQRDPSTAVRFNFGLLPVGKVRATAQGLNECYIEVDVFDEKVKKFVFLPGVGFGLALSHVLISKDDDVASSLYASNGIISGGKILYISIVNKPVHERYELQIIPVHDAQEYVEK